MPDPSITTDVDDEIAQFLRDSGVIRAMQQQALEANLRHVASSQGFEVLHVSHRHYPAVEFSAYMGDLDDRHNTVHLRAQVCRLLRAASVRVRASNVFARYRRAVVRVACAPDWD